VADAADAAAGSVAVLARPVVLVGMMGSGKTTVGKKIASKLQVPFVDTDAEIERRTDRSIAELFDADGEAAFREIESAMLAEVLVSDEPKVVATGGGAVLAASNRALLRERATVIWLHATAGVLAHRTRQDTGRPLLTGDHRAMLERLLAEREPLYREVADHVVDIDLADRKVVLARVLDAITSDARVRGAS